MQLRRSLVATAGVLALTVPALASCGFDLATNRPYTPAEGANSVDADVKVLAAVVVAAQPDSGTFIATLVNNSRTEPATFEGISGAEGNTIQPGEFEPVEIPPNGLVNLATEGGAPLSGTFGVGDFLPITVNVADGTAVTLNVPVVRACGEYAGLDVSGSEEAGAEGEVEAYSCEHPDAEAEH